MEIFFFFRLDNFNFVDMQLHVYRMPLMYNIAVIFFLQNDLVVVHDGEGDKRESRLLECRNQALEQGLLLLDIQSTFADIHVTKTERLTLDERYTLHTRKAICFHNIYIRIMK